ncbi:ABC transporter permease [Frankia tisae]|uniref:ABC transporter permease n=1 Tax=Frankia tisae TaxID=2950104 RepID=UPI0021BF6923|nr:ABC transporter permease [Frankia tisae]
MTDTATTTTTAATAAATDVPRHRLIGHRLIGLLRSASRGARFGDILAFSWILILIIFVALPGMVTKYAPDEAVSASFQSPSGAHWFGTDYLGRDLYSRVVYGASRTLAGSLIAVVIGLAIGIVLGLIAAYFGRLVDALIGRVVDVLLSIPGLLLSMVVVVALGFGAFSAAVAVGVANIATFTRLMRSEVLTVRNLQFVEASSHLGAGKVRILARHILPNSYGSVLSLSALQLGSAIIWIASLSFLGYGAPPPNPEWGLLVSEGRKYIISSPWLLYFPGVAIVVSVIAISRFSHFIRKKVG